MVTPACCALCSSTSPAICSGVTSGWSPERTTTGPSPVWSRAARTAAPVPSPSRCSATVTVVRQPVGDAVTGPDDAHDPRGTGRDGGVDDPLDHGLAADPVQDLGSPGPHPRALAGGHDEDREGLGHGPRRVTAEAEGLCSSATGEWCNRQHRALDLERGFKSLLPSSSPSAVGANICSCRDRAHVQRASRRGKPWLRPCPGRRRCDGSACVTTEAPATSSRSMRRCGEYRPTISTPTRLGAPRKAVASAARGDTRRGLHYTRGQLKERLYEAGLKDRRCELCGHGEVWRGRRMWLILDHVNGVSDRQQAREPADRLPNCAATLDTHCGRGSCSLSSRSDVPALRRRRFSPKYADQALLLARVRRRDRTRTERGPRPEARKVERPPYRRSWWREVKATGLLHDRLAGTACPTTPSANGFALTSGSLARRPDQAGGQGSFVVSDSLGQAA